MTYLEDELDSFEPAERRAALAELAAKRRGVPAEAGTNVNLHFHSFFSYNAEGWSPSHIAWETRKAGLYAAGLCDFDALDGLQEFLDAGLTLGLRTCVSVETRVFVKEFADVDISSPGEPGVTYIMGAGFARVPEADSPQAAQLAGFRAGARDRNAALVNRINPHMSLTAVDYEADVLPLTPAGNATERHVVSAYLNKAREVFGHPEATAKFWSRILGKDLEETVGLLADTPAMEEAVRAKLVKKGGVGYEQPSPTSFPAVEDFVRWALSCEAMPMITWLDGTSGGEKDAQRLLACMTGKGCVALNIIPDRNWNVSDPARKAVRVANLRTIVKLADEQGLPINIGTEMNKAGLPFVDDLEGEVLREFKESFLRGARIVVGHTLLSRYAGFPYTGKAAQAEFGSDVMRKNAFFDAVGGLPPLDETGARRLSDLGPDKALARFRDGRGRETR
jgi:hypothetical protein